MKRLLRRRLCPEESRARVGMLGERAAARFLARWGYVIWERNWRSGRGEIDIVASRSGTLVFVEVKTRSRRAAERFPPSAAVDAGKKTRLESLAWRYLAARRARCTRSRIRNHRFDIIAITYERRWLRLRFTIEHLENAY